MGKGSNLRNRQPEHRYEYSDGSRKLYDRDKMPEGLDEDIWHLTLYFEQVAESYHSTIPGRPIVYTELSHRIRNTVIRQYPDYVPLLEDMIDTYFDMTVDDSVHSINNFCSLETFNHILGWVLETISREELLSKGLRIKQGDNHIQPTKASYDDRKTLRIIYHNYSEAELKDKMSKFREEHESGS